MFHGELGQTQSKQLVQIETNCLQLSLLVFEPLLLHHSSSIRYDLGPTPSRQNPLGDGVGS